MIRIDGPTPNGGVYSETYFYDENGKEVEKEQATKAYGCEFDANGNLICESFFTLTPNESIKKESTEDLEKTQELPKFKM